MLSRGKKLLSLVLSDEDNDRLQKLNLPTYESTKGVEVSTINTEELNLFFNSGMIK